MKKISFIVGLIFLLLLTSFSPDKKFDKPEDLGKEIFELIKSKNLQGILDLVATSKDVAVTIDKSGQSGPEVTSFKEQMISKMDDDKEKTKERIAKGYEKIIADIKKKKCNKSIQIGKITPMTNKLKNYPIELGQIEVEYKCDDVSEIFAIEIISTTAGWRILEKLRIVAKSK